MPGTKTKATGDRPAILGGPPAFPEMMDIVRPGLPSLEEVAVPFAEVLANGKITNNQRYLRAFEEALGERFGRPVLATANGTLALMLVLRALGGRGEIVMPSFTFAATAHAAVWAGLRPRFADIDPETWTLSPGAAARACTSDTVSASTRPSSSAWGRGARSAPRRGPGSMRWARGETSVSAPGVIAGRPA
jgi:hypothetical protein